MSLDDLSHHIHDTAVEKGFWSDSADINFMLAKLALIHSEISEILEALRKEKGVDAIEEECADVLIRLLDFIAGAKDNGWLDPHTSFDAVVKEKMEINESRPRKHGNLI